MKTTIPILIGTLILCGCASERNPLLTGNPKDWRGHPTSDLVTVGGQPTRIIKQSDGEIWQYVKEWDAVVPKGSHASFNMRGFGDNGSSAVGGGGGFSSHEQYNAHFVRTDNFAVRNGIIRKWYGEIDENGQVVLQRH
jgi:hypothetical protein